MTLKNYLKPPEHSLIREALVNHRLSYDLKLAAAYQSYNLIVTRPDIDLSGFDLVFDDGTTDRKVQIKTVFSDSKTRTWDIRKLLISPTPNHLRKLGCTTIPPWIGLEGGFVLATVGVDRTGKELCVSYSYSSFYTIAMAELEIQVADKNEIAKDTIRELMTIGDDKVPIKKRLLVSAESPMHLLALMGLRSFMIYNWHADAMQLCRIKLGLETNSRVTRAENSMRQTVKDAITGQVS